jgi:hypothetical protein
MPHLNSWFPVLEVQYDRDIWMKWMKFIEIIINWSLNLWKKNSALDCYHYA